MVIFSFAYNKIISIMCGGFFMPNGQSEEERCREIIYSEDYIDLIFDARTEVERIQRQYEIGCIQRLDRWQSIVHVRVRGNVSDFIGNFPYRQIPKCYGLLDTSNVEDTGVLRLRRRPYIDLYGNNVIVAILDTGIDYLHPVFRNPDNTTRIIGIWDQSIETGPPPEGLLYGTYYSQEQINQAIASETPYEIVPSLDESGHGTFMAGIAAGNMDEENDFTGIAPQAKIVVVKLKQAKENLREYYGIKEEAIAFQETDILMAFKYIFWESARELKPFVLCMGFGTNQGDHNGNSVLGNILKSIGFVIGVGSVIAAGNETNQRHHFFSELKAEDEYEEVEIQVGEGERGFTLELWAAIPLLYSIGVVSPEGEFSNRIPATLGRNDRIDYLFENTKVFIKYEIIEVGSGDELITFNFQNPTPGIWKIRVYNDADFNGEYHMWLPMREFISNDTFFVRSNPYTTICEPGNAARLITTSAYNHKNGSIYTDSSRGYTKSGGIKPIITAPGVNIYGPVPGGGFGVRSGTSVAAAHTAGVCILLLEWGIVNGNLTRMSTVDLERLIVRGARRDNRMYPNREWGYGILDIIGAFETLRTTI